MKNLLYSLMLFAVLASVGCKKDSNADPLVGIWSLTSVELLNGQSITNDNGDISTSSMSMVGKDITAEVNLKDDGKYASQGQYTASYIIDLGGGNVFEYDIPVPAFSGTGTWSRAGNIFTTKDDASSEQGESAISAETDNSFTLTTELNEVTNQGGGVIQTAKGQVIYKLVRK
jgi:hypothetical protein